MTVSLAGSLFFDVGVGAARPKVFLYLMLTVLPFAFIAPVVGPFLDRTRGGRRMMIALAMLGRAVLCISMSTHIHSWMLFPLAFGALVLAKAQSVAKSALVPAVISDKNEFVLANSRLAIIGVLGGAVAAPFATLVYRVLGAPTVLRFGTAVFLLGTFAAFGIPRAERTAPEETPSDREILHAPSIRAAGTAMGLLRFVVGFFTFFAAFALKRAGEPAWMFGVVFVASAFGGLVGTVLAPLLRRKVREEWILVGTLLAPAIPLVIAARSYGRPALVIAAMSVAASAACGRVAFDSLLQRDGAEAARGRAFARFETRFQVVWVAGGVLAVLYPGGGRGGIFLVTVVLLFAGLSYVGTVRRTGGRNAQAPPPPAE